MASTNKTANLELSQFVGTDKPAWLTDYNADMGKIDTAVAGNTANIATNTSNITTLNTNLATTDGKADTAITTANTASGVASSAQTDATSALNTANALNQSVSELNTKVSGIINAFTLNNTGTVTLGSVSGVTMTAGNIRYALNSDGSIGKIYTNNAVFSNTGSSGTKIIPLTGLTVQPTGEEYLIQLGKTFSSSAYHDAYLIVSATGQLSLRFSMNSNETLDVLLPPCLLFFKDFGDILTNN